MVYKTGKVYRIICLSNPDIQYVGSTFNELRQRFSIHKCDYKRWLKNDDDKKCSIFPYFLQYGLADFKIVLIKEYLVCCENNRDHKHLSIYEQLWINKIKCVNSYSCFTTEWLCKMRNAEYYQKNKEKIYRQQVEYQAEYREKHKEKKAKYNAEYRKKHKEKIAEDYQKNKNNLSCKVTCDCGAIVNLSSLTRHKKTKRHQNLLLQKK